MERSAARVAQVLRAIDIGPVAGFDIVPLPAGPEGTVIVRIGGVDHPLIPLEARLLAACLSDPAAFTGSPIIARALRDQAAEAMALAATRDAQANGVRHLRQELH